MARDPRRELATALDDRFVELCEADPRLVVWFCTGLHLREPPIVVPRRDLESRRERDVATVHRVLDHLLVCHLEWQTRWPPDIGSRMLRYAVDLVAEVQEPFRLRQAVVTLVRTPAMRTRDAWPPFEAPLRVRFAIVALSDLDAREALHTGPDGVAALVPAMRGGCERACLDESFRRLLRLDAEWPTLRRLIRFHGALAELTCGSLDLWREVAMSHESGWTDEDADRALAELFRPIEEKAERRGWERGVRRGTEEGLRRGTEEGLRRGTEEGMRQGMQQGIEQGIEQGMQQGAGRATEAIVRRMHARGLSPEAIADFTGVERSQVDSILEGIPS